MGLSVTILDNRAWATSLLRRWCINHHPDHSGPLTPDFRPLAPRLTRAFRGLTFC